MRKIATENLAKRAQDCSPGGSETDKGEEKPRQRQTKLGGEVPIYPVKGGPDLGWGVRAVWSTQKAQRVP